MMPFLLRRRTFLFLVLVTAASALPHGSSPAGSGPRPASLDTSLDELLGRGGRARFAAGLKARKYGGHAHEWSRYAAWGRELLIHGRVKKPPVGPAPSAPLAKQYRCVHCHNLEREDPKLRAPDPEARERLIRERKPAAPERRDGTVLSLTPGTTLWGAVNREAFYNGYYTKYHRLMVAGGRRMDPASLADSIQVCCRYCSDGRFPEPWELDSLLAALWELEVRLRDLDLTAAEQKEVLEAAAGKDADALTRARGLLRRGVLRWAEARPAALPLETRGNTVVYPGGRSFKGNPEAGRLLYRSACAGCHNGELHDVSGARLAQGDRTFHKYVWRGTERDGLYMPMFTAQRLSPRQAADIRAFLKGPK